MFTVLVVIGGMIAMLLLAALIRVVSKNTC